MSEKQIGPNSCHDCGGDYGEHKDWCAVINKQLEAAKRDRYLEGISGDLFVQSPDFGRRAALAMDLLSFCTQCGAVVYRRDLHDAWHEGK